VAVRRFISILDEPTTGLASGFDVGHVDDRSFKRVVDAASNGHHCRARHASPPGQSDWIHRTSGPGAGEEGRAGGGGKGAHQNVARSKTSRTAPLLFSGGRVDHDTNSLIPRSWTYVKTCCSAWDGAWGLSEKRCVPGTEGRF